MPRSAARLVALLASVPVGAAAACAAPAPVSPPPVARPAPVALTPGPRIAHAIAVARDIDLYAAPYGSPHVGHVVDGDVLEWRADGYVRARTEAGELAGYPPPERTPRIGKGIGLFVAGDVAITDEDGRRLGTAHRGAFVQLVRMDETTAEVRLFPWAITGSIARRDLTTTRAAAPEPPRYADFVDNREILFAVGAGQLATRCDAPTGLFAEADGTVRIAQSIAGIELTGTSNGEGDRCRPRVIHEEGAPIPSGWRAPGPFPSKAFAKARDWYRLSSCEKVHFLATRKGGTLTETFTSEWTLNEALGLPKRLHYTVVSELIGAAPVLGKPTRLELGEGHTVRRDDHGKIIGRVRGEGEGVDLSGAPSWLFVGESPEGLLMLPHEDGDVRAYHPDDVSVWYASSATCQAAQGERQRRIGGHAAR